MTTEGWYRDPSGLPGTNRWWDGTAWTEHTQIAALPPPRPAPPTGPALAGYGARVGGWVLDWLIVGALTTPCLFLFHAIVHRTTFTTLNGAPAHGTSVSVGTRGVLIHAVIVLLYGTIFCGSRRGQTIGMMAAGTRAVDIAHGTPIGYPRAFGRALLEYVFFVIVLLPWIIDMLFPLWDSMNQTLHDKATRTIVIEASSQLSPPPVGGASRWP